MLSALLLSVSGGNASAAVSPMNHKQPQSASHDDDDACKHAAAVHAAHQLTQGDKQEQRREGDKHANGIKIAEDDHRHKQHKSATPAATAPSGREHMRPHAPRSANFTVSRFGFALRSVFLLLRVLFVSETIDSKVSAAPLPPSVTAAADASLPAGVAAAASLSSSGDSLDDPHRRLVPSSTPHTVRSLTSGYELSRARGTLRGDPKASPPGVPGDDEELALLQQKLPEDFLQRQRGQGYSTSRAAAAAAATQVPASAAVLPPADTALANGDTVRINSNLSRFMRTELGSQIFINQLCSGGFFLKHSAPALSAGVGPSAPAAAAAGLRMSPAPSSAASSSSSSAGSAASASHSPHWRLLWVSRDLRVVYWGEMTHALAKRPSGMIHVADILVMLCGHRTRTFTDIYGASGGEAILPAIAPGSGVRHCSPSCCLSLVTPSRTLDLECTSAPERELWALAFQFLLDQHRERNIAGPQQQLQLPQQQQQQQQQQPAPTTLRASSPSVVGVDGSSGVPQNLSLVSALEILSDLVVLGPTHAAFSYFIPELPPSPAIGSLTQAGEPKPSQLNQRRASQQSSESSVDSSTRTSVTTSPMIGGGGGATGPSSLRRLASTQPQPQRSISVGAGGGGGDGSASTGVSSATPLFFGSPQQPQRNLQQPPQHQQQSTHGGLLHATSSSTSLISSLLSSSESTGSPPTNFNLNSLERRTDSAGSSSLLQSPPRLASTTGATIPVSSELSLASIVPFFPTLEDAGYGESANSTTAIATAATATSAAAAVAGPPSASSSCGPPPPVPSAVPGVGVGVAGMPRRKSFGSLEPLTEAPDEEGASAGGIASKPSAAALAASHALLPPTASIPREVSGPSGSPMPLLQPSTHEPPMLLGSRSIGMAAVAPAPEPLRLPPPASTIAPASSRANHRADAQATVSSSSADRPSATHSSLHSLYMSIQGGVAARSSAAAAAAAVASSGGSIGGSRALGASDSAMSPDAPAPVVLSARQEAELLRLDRCIHRERSDHAHLRLWVAHRFMHLQSHINSLCIERSKLQRRLEQQAQEQEKQFEREVARIAGATPKTIHRSIQDRSHSAAGELSVTVGASR